MLSDWEAPLLLSYQQLNIPLSEWISQNTRLSVSRRADKIIFSRFNSEAEVLFELPLREFDVTPPDTYQRDDISKRLLLDISGLKLGLHEEDSERDQRLVQPEEWRWLAVESAVLHYLRSNSLLWREGAIWYRFIQNRYSPLLDSPESCLFHHSKSVIFGNCAVMTRLCAVLNSRVVLAERRLDSTSFLLPLPMDVFKGPPHRLIRRLNDDFRTFVAANPLREERRIMDRTLDKFFEWTSSYGAAYASTHVNSWANVFGRNHPDHDKPHWLIGNFDVDQRIHDQELSVLVNVTIYNDRAVYALPGGKRGFAETRRETALRKIEQKCGLRMIPHEGNPHYFHIAPMGVGAEDSSQSFSFTEVYQFTPNDSANTSVFEVSESMCESGGC